MPQNSFTIHDLPQLERPLNYVKKEPDVVFMKLNPQKYAKFKQKNAALYRGKGRPVFERNFRLDGQGVRGVGIGASKELQIKGAEKAPKTYRQIIKGLPNDMVVPKIKRQIEVYKTKFREKKRGIKGVRE